MEARIENENSIEDAETKVIDCPQGDLKHSEHACE